MALTKEQWYKKLKNMVPTWVFEKRVENHAIFMGLASVLELAQQNADDHLKETYIDECSEEFLSLHGAERSVERFPFEQTSSYRQRVKQIVNNSNLPAIKRIVDTLLIRGEATVIEHTEKSGNFLNRGSYLNRNIIEFTVLYNAFTILIDYQIPEPTSFLNRGLYLNREFLSGSNVSSDDVFINIIKAVNKNKAYGTVYRLIERANK